MDLEARHWLVALVSALAVHLALLILFKRPVAPPAPMQGIQIELGYGGDAGGGVPGSEDLLPFGAEELGAIAPEIAKDLVAEAEAVVTPEAETVLAETVAPASPSPTRRPKAKPGESKKTPKAQHKEKTATGPAGESAHGGGKGRAGKGSGYPGAGESAGGAGSGVSATTAKSRYAGQIAAWLNRNKRYPRQARAKGQQGLVRVRFTVDRDGQVLSSSIVESSGHTALDEEVRALMRRGRMPRMPGSMRETRMTMTVPIRFRLQ